MEVESTKRPTTLKIPYRVKMVDTATGEVRILRDSYGWAGFKPDQDGGWKHDLQFYWADGNQSCDGNRAEAWYYMVNQPVPDWVEKEFHCGNSRFAVPYLILDDGEQIWVDEES